MISSLANGRTSIARSARWQCPCNDAALIDGSCGVDKDFLSPFTYWSSHRRDEGARECTRTVRNATIHKEPISISLMTAWRHSSACSSSSCFLPGCQKRPAVKVRTTKLRVVHSPFCPQVGVGLFLAENVAWKLEWMEKEREEDLPSGGELKGCIIMTTVIPPSVSG